MPLNTKIGGPVKYIKDKETICLTNNQARHIYKKLESESVLNVDTIKQEREEDKLDRNMDEDEINPYHEIITNKVGNENIITMQMEQWSILNNIVNYVQYGRHPENFYYLDVKTIDQKSHRKIYDKLKEEDRQILELDFGSTPEKLKGDYLDMYEGIQSEVISTTRFGENSDLSMTYLGKIDISRASKIKAEEKNPYIRTRVYGRKIIRQYRMSDTI